MAEILTVEKMMKKIGASGERSRIRAKVVKMRVRGGPIGLTSLEVDEGWVRFADEILCWLDEEVV
jgi:hypothetical protein